MIAERVSNQPTCSKTLRFLYTIIKDAVVRDSNHA